MINITTIESEKEFNNLRFQNKTIDLSYHQNIERYFRLVLEFHEEAFRDKESLRFMQAIDNAVRTGDYGVVTPFGKSCITCLSTGCKLGLLLLYYMNKENIRIITEFWRAGKNVWDFLGKNYTVNLYMKRSAFYSGLYRSYSFEDPDKGLTVDGTLYGQKDWFALFSEHLKCEEEPFNMTKEKEEEAYKAYGPKNNEIFRGYFREELSLKELYDSVLEKGCVSEEDCPTGYKVVNHCSSIPNDYHSRRTPLWTIGKKGTKYEFRRTISVKYPTFLELLLIDILNGSFSEGLTEQKFYQYKEVYDEYLVLVLEGEERCEISEYPKNTLYGVLCKPKEKLITIYNNEQSVQKFHEMITKASQIIN